MLEWFKPELNTFTKLTWMQEAAVTSGRLKCLPVPQAEKRQGEDQKGKAMRTLAEFSIPSQPGNERQAMEQVAAVVATEIELSSYQVARLKTAVAEAIMNALEHGNHFQADLYAKVQVLTAPHVLVVRIIDHGGGQLIPVVHEPNLQAKLDGLQSPRGWGLFLIKNMVDEMHVSNDGQYHTVELVFHV